MPPRSLADVLAELPPMCAAHLPATGEAVLLRRGVRGYQQAPRLDVDAFNAIHGVTGPQREAMLAGCLLGFEVRGADPLNYLDESS